MLANKACVSTLLLQQKAGNRSGKDREPERKAGDIKSKNTEEAYRQNMGQTEKDRESSM